MADIEKVIKGLDCCLGVNDCDIERNGDCPYKDLPICATFLCSDALELLKEQQKTGRWIDVTKVIGFPRVQCSVCGTGQGAAWMNYCPICGTKMKNAL